MKRKGKINWSEIGKSALGALGALVVTKKASDFVQEMEVVPVDMKKYVPAVLSAGTTFASAKFIPDNSLAIGGAVGGGVAMVGAVASAAGMSAEVKKIAGVDMTLAGMSPGEIEVSSVEELEALARAARKASSGTLQGNRLELQYDEQVAQAPGTY